MKIFKYICTIAVFLLVAGSCTKDNDNLYSFGELTAPMNITASFDIAQDNSGLVTILPSAEGATKYLVSFGDVADETPSEYLTGEEISHIYTDGTYNVVIKAVGITGLSAEYTQEITVSFMPPENLVITVENDIAVSKQLNISADADYATVIEVYFGELAEDTAVITLPGEPVSHVYENPGDYSITVIAKSGSPITLDSTFTFTVIELVGPQNAAPAPPARDAADVISVFSDAYSSLSGTNFNPNWGQSTIVTDVVVASDNVLKYSNLNYQGTEFASAIDASSMEYLHVDVWTDDADALNMFCISSGTGNEKAYALAITKGQWVSYDIPLSHFSDVVDLSDIIQFKVDGTGGSTVYFDNIYFYKGAVVTEPATAAPTPTLAEADVISLFSDAYTDVTVDTWRTDWSVGTLEEVTVAGNAAKKYSALDFVGIETVVAGTIDATSMTHFHIDVWSADFTQFSVKLVDFGADGAWAGNDDVEHQIDYSTPAKGQWVSYDIPLSDFTNLTTKGHMAQYILVGQPTGATTVWVDNVYFHK